jgi:hypothetical protein
MRRLSCVLALGLCACGLSVEFRGEENPARRPADVVTLEQAPTRPYHVAGTLVATSDSEMVSRELSDVLEALRAQAAKKGCDALRWNPNHVLVSGIDVSNDPTGVFEQNVYGRRFITGGRAECLRWGTAR